MDFLRIFKSGCPAVVEEENVDNVAKIKDFIDKGYNVFVTGGAGTGKSHTLRELKEYYGDTLHITSTTGISALNVNGQTIHSWSGMGFVNEPRRDFDKKVTDAFFKIKNKEFLYQKLFDAKMLAIDEISMLDNVTFDFINTLLKKIRHNNKPFGGIQIILFGDFFQLPPVSKEIGYDFCFYSKTWDELDLKSVILTENKRTDDPIYIEALNNLREGIVVTENTEMFEKRVEESKKIEEEDRKNVTHVYGTNKEAEDHNRKCFAMLDTSVYSYPSHDVFIRYEEDPQSDEIKFEEIEIPYNHYGYYVKGRFERDQEILIKNFNEECRAPHKLVLRVGARVMLTRNNRELNLANGSCGNVVELTNNSIVVKFDKLDSTVSVPKTTFDYYHDDRVVIKRYQYPLTLAYAMTIHKSQGLTVDQIAVNFDKIFDHGQGYVALSRTTTLKGLILDSYNPDLVTASEDVKNFYKVLEEKGSFSEEDYPESKLERLDFESRLDIAINNESIMKKKVEKIKKHLNKDIWINYLEKKQGWKVVKRKIKPSMVDTGRNLDEINPLPYKRKNPDKYYIDGWCYLRNDEREFKPEMLEIVDEDIPDIDYSYTREDGTTIIVNTLDEIQKNNICIEDKRGEIPLLETKIDEEKPIAIRRIIAENQIGVTYENLFVPYLKGVNKITLTDSYIRNYFQLLNLKDFLNVVAENRTNDDKLFIKLKTSKDADSPKNQEKTLDEIKKSYSKKGIEFSYNFDAPHARSIQTDTGWIIDLDRGLDIYQKCKRNNYSTSVTESQKNRPCKEFRITYLKNIIQE